MGHHIKGSRLRYWLDRALSVGKYNRCIPETLLARFRPVLEMV